MRLTTVQADAVKQLLIQYSKKGMIGHCDMEDFVEQLCTTIFPTVLRVSADSKMVEMIVKEASIPGRIVLESGESAGMRASLIAGDSHDILEWSNSEQRWSKEEQQRRGGEHIYKDGMRLHDIHRDTEQEQHPTELGEDGE